MKRARYSVFMFSVLSLVSPANAAVTALDDGNAVLQNCTSENPFSKGMCSGLITGYFEGMQTNYSCAKVNSAITRQQIRDVVIKFLQDNAADRHFSGMQLAYRAFYGAFDCKKN